MKGIIYESFGAVPRLTTLDDPTPERHGVVIQVKATGLCRSDWHGWMGHDPDIILPHVPGHELAGIIAEVGRDVTRWNVGDRVTVPFVAGCGHCPECYSGNHQVCENQFQPGFTHWGSFAEWVSIHNADINLVKLPDSVDFPYRGQSGMPFCDFVPGRGGSRQSVGWSMGRGTRLRWRGTLGDHDRERDWSAGGGH